MTQERRLSPFWAAFRATLGVLACLIFLFILGCSALSGVLMFIGHSASQNAIKRPQALDNTQAPQDKDAPMLESILSSLDYQGREGNVTYYVARGVTSENALLYLAATGKYLIASSPTVSDKGKILLITGIEQTDPYIGMVNFREGKPDYISVAPNVDEVVGLTDVEWNAINEFDRLFYKEYKGQLSVEQENALREMVSEKHKIAHNTWVKRLNASLQEDVTQQVLRLIENRLVANTSLPKRRTLFTEEDLYPNPAAPQESDYHSVPACESGAKVTLVTVHSGVPLVYVESLGKLERLQPHCGEAIYKSWTLESIGPTGRFISVVDSATGRHRSISQAKPVILE